MEVKHSARANEQIHVACANVLHYCNFCALFTMRFLGEKIRTSVMMTCSLSISTGVSDIITVVYTSKNKLCVGGVWPPPGDWKLWGQGHGERTHNLFRQIFGIVFSQTFLRYLSSEGLRAIEKARDTNRDTQRTTIEPHFGNNNLFSLS